MTTTTTRPLPPGPAPGRETREMLGLFRRDILAGFDAITARYGDVSTVRAGVGRLVVVRGAEAARQVLVTRQGNYPKSEQFQLFRRLLGDGLVTSSGESWREHRTVVQPMFAKRHLVPFTDHMAAAAAAGLADWEKRWPDGTRVDVPREILRVGLDTVGRALVSHDFGAASAVLERSLAGSLREIGRIGRSPLVFLGQDLRGLGIVRAAQLSTPRRWRRYGQSADDARAVFAKLIDERLARGHGERRDLVRLLMETEEGGRRLGRQEVLDEVVTFVMAGHETTAHGLSWMFHLLAASPATRERLHAEVDDVLGGRTPAAADAELLPWTTACFQEAMRLYPPVWQLPRGVAEDDELAGYRIPRGSRVMVSVWSTHRDPAVWHQPLIFDPSRWIGDAPKVRPRFAYLPFGGGRRACIGQGFAMLNAVILAAMIAQRFQFDAEPGAVISIEPTITLRPAEGIPMRVRRRSGSPCGARLGNDRVRE